MTHSELVLAIALAFMVLLYITSKLGSNKKLSDVIVDVKEDLIATTSNVADMVLKAKDILFDESIQKTIKEFILIVEEKNRIAKVKGEAYLTGDEKKKAVVGRLCEWVGNVTGSIKKGLEFVQTNQSKIESIINDYVSFSNKMEGKSTLSESEKIIQQELYK
jgi:hypothetical protein